MHLIYINFDHESRHRSTAHSRSAVEMHRNFYSNFSHHGFLFTFTECSIKCHVPFAHLGRYVFFLLVLIQNAPSCQGIVELIGTQNGVSKVFPGDELAELEWAMAGSLPDELPDAELIRSPHGELYRVQVSKTEPILPKQINNPTPAVALADPTPWAEAYKEQQKYGNLALIAIGLAVLFASIGAPQMLIVAAGLAGIGSFILNRRKRKEVIDIKEFSGYDVTEERRDFKTTNRLLGGAAFVIIIGYIIVAILVALAFIALIEGLFSW